MLRFFLIFATIVGMGYTTSSPTSSPTPGNTSCQDGNISNLLNSFSNNLMDRNGKNLFYV